jgi:hypothetical protein
LIQQNFADQIASVATGFTGEEDKGEGEVATLFRTHELN